MLNRTLYIRELKNSLKLGLIFAAVLTMYVVIMINLYDPNMRSALDKFAKTMPQLMAALGIRPGSTGLLGFLMTYLYGFILLIFPMLFTVIRANGLIARYVERGSIVTLLAAPVKRSTVALTQLTVLISGLTLLLLYTTCLELILAKSVFPQETLGSGLLRLNLGLWAMQMLIAGISFSASCLFNDSRLSLGVGAGLPALMLLLQMLADTSPKVEKLRLLTFFSLYDPQALAAGESAAWLSIGILLLLAVLFMGLAVVVFDRKDLQI